MVLHTQFESTIIPSYIFLCQIEKTTMASIITSRFAIFVALLLLQLGLVSAGSTHHHHKREVKKASERKTCRDRAGVHCGMLAHNRNCDQLTNRGESYGDSVCPVSCGRCEEAPDEIYTDHLCYPFAKQSIEVHFSNSNPHHEDWVGIYPETADSYDLGSPVAWFWSCGNKKLKCATSVSSVTFNWLPEGTYKAVLSRNKDAMGPYANYGPYASYAESQTFEVARGNACAMRRLVDESDAATTSSLRGTQQ